MENIKSRNILALLGLLFGFVWFSPNIINVNKVSWWPAQKKLNYGLDIQGGLHLVMGVDVPGVVAESTNRLANQIKAELEKEGTPGIEVSAIEPTQGKIAFNFSDPAAKAQVEKILNDRYGTMLQIIEDDDKKIVARYLEIYLRDYQQRVVSQSIETIRNRIDEFGVAEPSISAQGTDRILVQLPGIKDAEQAKSLIKTAAKLEFRMVNNEKAPAELQALITEAEKAGGYTFSGMRYSDYINRLNQDLAGKLPEKTVVFFQKSENAENLEAGRIPYLVTATADLGGGDLDDAFVSFDQFGNPEVSLTFNPAGANKFAELTGASIGKNMAIVLDRVVKSAPVIQSRIAGGHARITLGSSRDRNKSLEEAKMISTSLRAGALPASMEQLEERTVGPTLGADSLRKAEFAAFMGALFIFLFMMLRYKASGIIANICVALNVFLTLALLTSLGATLTLPGIAGIALTVGFAVDANVLIFERIREELRTGSGFRLALKEGYGRAMSAIIDANITTAATAIVLLYFGTGPVKGFAVTLLIGIGTTMFTNVFVSKVIYDNLIYKFNRKQISV